ncbi:hypothetical protein CS542_00270 [Pedobacter sp. IW39]|nr:hypothetical protein CS542_00270 [Pedobacter sp. IW39]
MYKDVLKIFKYLFGLLNVFSTFVQYNLGYGLYQKKRERKMKTMITTACRNVPGRWLCENFYHVISPTL